VNKFRLEEEPCKVPIFRPDPKSVDSMIERVRWPRKERDNGKFEEALHKLEEATLNGENTYPASMGAVRAYATVGELCRVRNKVHGIWRYPHRHLKKVYRRSFE
jgi:methylmalonyl-CoA mutase N-terminal domain/subunit